MAAVDVAFDVTMNREAVRHADDLIEAGKIEDGGSWSGPSPDAENDLIESEGWDDFGRWYLGRQSDADPESKAHYRYPFSNDFETISVKGLKAIRSRSAQNDEEDIFAAAGRMLEAIEKKMAAEIDRTAKPLHADPRRFTFQATIGKVDRASGVLRDVVIIEAGEARGHRMMISERSVEAANELLRDVSLPAYITHAGAYGDRLLNEIGVFSDFYRDGDRIRAARFEILPSFREDQPEQFARLFDLAERLPQTFGISIVFEGSMFWETEDGAEEFTGYGERPEDALFGFPTITPTRIESADFVDTPAATSSLFSEGERDKPFQGKDMDENTNDQTETLTTLAESASAELERRKAEEAGGSPEPEAAPAKPKKAAKKKKLKSATSPATSPEPVAEKEVEPETEDLDAIEDEAEADDEPTSEVELRIAERDVLIGEQQEQIKELQNQIETLKKVFSGQDEIDDDLAVQADAKPVDLKADAITDYLQANPSHSRMTAVLQVAKKSPELFQLN